MFRAFLRNVGKLKVLSAAPSTRAFGWCAPQPQSEFLPPSFAVKENEGKLSQQEPARAEGADWPTPRGLNYFADCTINLGVELESSIGATFQVPIKCRVVFGGGFLVKTR